MAHQVEIHNVCCYTLNFILNACSGQEIETISLEALSVFVYCFQCFGTVGWVSSGCQKYKIPFLQAPPWSPLGTTGESEIWPVKLLVITYCIL